MADFVFNVAKGRVAELFKRVDDGDPAAARLLVVAINTAATDATLRDLDTLAAIEADANTAEVTNTNYARKTLAAADVAFTVDDDNDRVDLDIADQTWNAVAAGDAWTDLLVCYIPDGVTPGADTTVIPLTCHDFSITPDGSNITAQINAAGFFRAS
jgi:hypothetical protein